MRMSFGAVSGKTRSLALLTALILFVGGVAIADIISGLSTTNSSTNVTITNLAINKPSDAVVGDVMLANVAIHDGNATTVTPPLGWTQILRTDNETNVSIVSYWKVVGASEPANYVWTLSPQTRAQGGITRYSGVDTANPIDISAGNSGRGTVATTSSVVTSSANEMIVTMYALHVGSNNHAGDFFSVPSGMTERYDASYTAAGPTIAEFDSVQAVPGSTRIKSSDIAGNRQRDWVSQIIALRPEVSSTLSDGLIHYWKLDEASGDAIDSVGSMTMTNMNGTQFAPGKINNSADLEFNNNNYFKTTTNITSSALSSYSACLWMNIESTPSDGGAYHLFGTIDESGAMDMQYVNFGGGNIALTMRHYATFPDVTLLQHNTVLSEGNFYHVCGTWDGLELKMYLNGLLTAGPILESHIRITESIGSAIGNHPGSGTPFDGRLDEVGFWTRALSASEIVQLYNGGSGLSQPF